MDIETAKLTQRMAVVRKDQAELAEALTQLATELTAREKRLDRRIDEALHEVCEASNHMKRASTANVDVAMQSFRAAVLKFARGVE
jgi:hypothetical protein